MRQEGRLAHPRGRLQDKVTAILRCQECIDLGGQPFTANKVIHIDALEDRPWLDVRIAQELVVAGEDPVMIAGDEDTTDDVTTDDNAPLAIGLGLRSAHRCDPDPSSLWLRCCRW